MPNFLLKKRSLVILMLLVSTTSLFITFSFAHTSPGTTFFNKTIRTDSIPNVLTTNHADLVASRLKNEAALKFSVHQLPSSVQEWSRYRMQLKNEIIKKTGAVLHQGLPLDMKETGRVKMQGYTIKNIAF